MKNPASKGEIVDSLQYKTENFNKVPDFTSGNYKMKDSISKLALQDKYYDIPKASIIKMGKTGQKIGILYSSASSLTTKYYLRISNDYGKTWKNYFTGLCKNNNYVFKPQSNFLLWKDENHIQIEADIVQMTEPLTLPGGGPVYETVKNNALVIINLKEILKDSDNDGWNDLDEKMNYFTNPFSKDSDGDGIFDSEDLNPKYPTIENDFTKIFEAIIYGNYPLLRDENSVQETFEINIKTFQEDVGKQQEELEKEFPQKQRDFLSQLRARIIVTDDENLGRINTFGERVIFLTTKEYYEYKKLNPFFTYVQSYTKIFKCDDLEDTYILKFDTIDFGNTYLIKKSKNGYIVSIVESWIV
ncbi:hypothetical protein [Chryseobacterium caseinilyticum]|uniref:Exo-alpha-sialidase n=1 Tax=Chryseobacterium caseinilyticum TaxID=2771428 RepID=A0ABR8Z6L0_9FLAO|nr:hypothetical protein [Chryseobacterium caseinilyticum]MBD8080933.1 hypothetical protein [Chryseobacterium caseinilyticum]